VAGGERTTVVKGGQEEAKKRVEWRRSRWGGEDGVSEETWEVWGKEMV